jgi:hypothetical protein
MHCPELHPIQLWWADTLCSSVRVRLARRSLARSRRETRRGANTKAKSPSAGDGNKHSRVPVLGKDANPFKKRGPDAQESTRSVALGSSDNRLSVARELAVISAVLDQLPGATELVHEALSWRGGKRVDPTKGRDGMAAEQVLRVAVLKQMSGFSYADLTSHRSRAALARGVCLHLALPPSRTFLGGQRTPLGPGIDRSADCFGRGAPYLRFSSFATRSWSAFRCTSSSDRFGTACESRSRARSSLAS